MVATQSGSALRIAARLPLALALAAGLSACPLAATQTALANDGGAKTCTAKTTVKIKKVKKLKVKAGADGTATVTWKTVKGANQYRVRCSLHKDMCKTSQLTSIKVKGAAAKKGVVTVEGLTPGKTYYFQIRSDKKIGSTIHRGKWSKLVKVKLRKAAKTTTTASTAQAAAATTQAAPATEGTDTTTAPIK